MQHLAIHSWNSKETPTNVGVSLLASVPLLGHPPCIVPEVLSAQCFLMTIILSLHICNVQQVDLQ